LVREAFKDLLEAWGRSRDLQLVPEYEIITAAKTRIYADGALLHSLRVPFRYWESKDDADDLDAEIAKKFRKGYPDLGSRTDFMTLAIDRPADIHFGAAIDAYQQVPLYRYKHGARLDNITDWALEQFRSHYEGGARPSPLGGEGAERSEADEGAAPPSSGASRHLLPSREKDPSRRAKLISYARSMRKAPTEAETALWKLLRNRRFSGFKFRRQQPVGDYIVDFVCLERKVIVEADPIDLAGGAAGRRRRGARRRVDPAKSSAAKGQIPAASTMIG
jgi:hypothetical protein